MPITLALPETSEVFYNSFFATFPAKSQASILTLPSVVETYSHFIIFHKHSFALL